jgi:hypothetical protein
MNTKPGEKNLSASKVRENAMTFLEEFRKHVKARDYDAALKLLRADPAEAELLRLENEHLRAALKRIVDLRHLSSTREMAEIAAFALRVKHYGT